MFWLPNTSFGWRVASTDGTRISTTWDTAITLGASNAKGSWTTVLSAITYDAYFICVEFQSGYISGTTLESLCDIGTDPAGGTSYTTVIPNLITTGAQFNSNVLYPYRYVFPIFISAGSTIGIRGQVNNGTSRAIRARIEVFGLPRGYFKYGTFVEAIGVDTANSRGTSVTPGTTSDGSWASLGTTTNPTWFHQIACSIGGAAYTFQSYTNDLSTNSGGEMIITDSQLIEHATEALTQVPGAYAAYYDVAGGSTLYGRSQCGGTPTSTYTMAAYCLG